MSEPGTDIRYRFGDFELDGRTGELWRRGVRVRLHVQPAQVLALLVARPGLLVTREEICGMLWPEGTFVDFDHGLNSAVSRLREALGDRASQPRFVETLARKGYRFLAAVELVSVSAEPVVPGGADTAVADEPARFLDRVLARPEDLPTTAPGTVLLLFVLLQTMYLGFYVGALANLGEIAELMSGLPDATVWLRALTVCAAVMIPVRVFLLCAAVFRAPGLRARYLRLWPFVAVVDLAWALSPLLLLNHISFGLAMACAAPLVYAPFAQRSLVLMGAGQGPARVEVAGPKK